MQLVDAYMKSIKTKAPPSKKDEPKTATRSEPLPSRKPPAKRKADESDDEEDEPAPKKKAKVTIDVSKLAELVKAAVGPKSAAKAPAAKEPKEKKEKAAPKKKEKSAVVEVEKIVGMRAGAKGLEYRIKWKGEKETTWESYENVMDDDLVDDFEEELQTKTFGSVDIVVGAKVEVRSVDEGFQNSWSEATVTGKKGKKYTVDYSAFVDSKGKKLSDSVDRSRLRPTQRGAPSGWTPQLYEVIEVSDDDCWWEAAVEAVKGKSATVKFRVSDEVKTITLGAKVRPCAWLKMAAPAK